VLDTILAAENSQFPSRTVRANANVAIEAEQHTRDASSEVCQLHPAIVERVKFPTLRRARVFQRDCRGQGIIECSGTGHSKPRRRIGGTDPDVSCVIIGIRATDLPRPGAAATGIGRKHGIWCGRDRLTRCQRVE
jgi:hypothetical protein